MMGAMRPIRWMFLVLILVYAWIFHQWIGVGFLLFVLFATLTSRRIEVDRIGQLIVLLVMMGVAYVFTAVIGPPAKHPISDSFGAAQAFFCFWMIAYGCFRLLLSNPLFGNPGTILVGLSGMFGTGGYKSGWVYHLFVFAFVVFAVWALGDGDPASPSLLRATPRRKVLFGIGVLIASAVALSLVITLPKAYAWATERLGMMIFNYNRTGFDMYFKLGSLNRLLKSRSVVFRVRGQLQPGLRLRGAVYDRYNNNFWVYPHKPPIRLLRVPTRPKKQENRVFVDYVSGPSDRYFVPLHAGEFVVPEGVVRVDVMGLVRPMPDEPIGGISFLLGVGSGVPMLKPRKLDLKVPKKLRPKLYALAQKWTQKVHTPEAKIQMLATRLRRTYRYSLSFQRPAGRDPLLDFLFHNKQGHCEYFATALALLGRSIGIPTRLIGGYLVTEYNDLGGYYVVREQNAHAWVEAWLPGHGWQTFDATPADSGLSEHMPSHSGRVAAFLDYVRFQIGRLRARIARMTWQEITLFILAALVFWGLIRLHRYLRERRASQAQLASLYRDPWPAFEAMMAALKPRLKRRESEPIECYARRLREEDEPASDLQDAAALIMEYASLRYGEIGDPADLQRRIEAWLQAYRG